MACTIVLLFILILLSIMIIIQMQKEKYTDSQNAPYLAFYDITDQKFKLIYEPITFSVNF